MKQPPLWITIVLVAGLAIMLGGPFVVGLLLPPEATLTQADAQAYTQAAIDLHSAPYGPGGHKHGPGDKHQHPPVAPDDPKLVAARQAFETQQRRRDEALLRHERIIWGTRGVGVLLAAVGVVAYLVTKTRS